MGSKGWKSGGWFFQGSETRVSSALPVSKGWSEMFQGLETVEAARFLKSCGLFRAPWEREEARTTR
jgi:hypothetical protein